MPQFRLNYTGQEIQNRLDKVDEIDTLQSRMDTLTSLGDGGYYTPSVDAGGNLSWTASKTGMPAIAGANIKGPKGDAGTSGEPGRDGATPQRGVDYWTDADKAEIKSYVDDAILGGAW